MNTPADFFTDAPDLQAQVREMAAEVVGRVLIWMAESSTLDERGLRSTVALYCVRPDLIEGASLEKLGQLSGRSRQAMHQLAQDFRATTGLRS
jgi:hypothetical protein